MDKSLALKVALESLLSLSSEELGRVVDDPCNDFIFSDMATLGRIWNSLNFSKIRAPRTEDIDAIGHVLFSKQLAPKVANKALFAVEEEYAWAA